MSENRWSPHGPPLEAYGRVTNVQRFASLHSIAAELLSELEDEFEVVRTDGYRIDPELEQGVTLAVPTVRLAPRHVGAAPIVMVFSAFPGLRVRFGRWCTRAFPVCGCDACDETAAQEVEQLRWLTGNLVAGRFRETIHIPSAEAAWSEWESWSDAARSGHKFQLDPDVARRLLVEGRSSYGWEPWSLRNLA